MATKTAILAVKIVSDAKGAKKGLDDTSTAVGKFGDASRKATPYAAGAIGAILLLADAAGDAASRLEQSAGAVESVFRAQADEVKKYADAAADNVGLAKSQYSQLAAVLGSQLKNMGTSEEALAGQTDNLIGLGADLAATFGGSTADAVGALSSLLRGERDPIERYGVSIKQADIEAQKAAMGLTGLEGEALKAADAQATLALLLDQTKDSAGQFAREGNTAAGAAERAAAKFEDAKAALGEQLLPIMTEGSRILTEFSGFLTENSDAVLIVAGVVLGLAGAVLLVNGAMSAYSAVMAIVTAAQWLFNAAAAANPIGLVIAVIIAIIALIVLLVLNWETVSAVVADLVDDWVAGFQVIIDWIQDVLGWVGKLFNSDIMNAGGIGMGGSYTVQHAGTWEDGDPGDPTGASGPWPAWAATTGSSTPTIAPVTNNYYNTGALDAVAVGRQIKQIGTAGTRMSGSSTAGGRNR